MRTHTHSLCAFGFLALLPWSWQFYERWSVPRSLSSSSSWQWFKNICRQQTTNLSSIDEFICHTFCNCLDVPESSFSCPSAQQPDGLQISSSFHSNSQSQPLLHTWLTTSQIIFTFHTLYLSYMILHSCMPHVWTNKCVQSLNTKIYFIQGTVQFQLLKMQFVGFIRLRIKCDGVVLTWLTRLSGDTSTACLLTVPARPIRVESSLGPELIIADTKTCSGFCKYQKVLGAVLVCVFSVSCVQAARTSNSKLNACWPFLCPAYKLHIPTTANKLNAMSPITLSLILLCISQHFQES